jgi:alkanesulfonate monooxygenase SsuD/methylene tetrahydromethanopterin reductase-like flavin-dependent oxidoreductase (luciferase family)
MTTTQRRGPRIGFLAFVEHTGIQGAGSEGLREGFRLFERAEELGYDAGWVRTRHLEPYLSAPLPFLAAVAQRTERLQLGTSVVPIRYEDPVRLAEDAATTDLITQGRLELGLSSGYAHNEEVFGAVYGRAGRTFDDEVEQRLQRFLHAVRGGTLAVADARTPFAAEGTPLTAQPLSPTFPERISYGAGRLATARRTGELGLRLQLSTLNTEITELSFEDAQARQIAAYREAYRASTGGDGFVSVGRMILPILDDADREAYAFLVDRSEQRQRALGTPGAPPLHFGVAHSGNPDDIVAALAADAGLRAADELVVALPFGHAPQVSHRILETVAREVVPALTAVARRE